jgi:hypothetical protein
VAGFYRNTIDVLSGQQEILSKYKKRFELYRDSMFTFLGDDEIPCLLSGLKDVDQYERKRRQDSSQDGALEMD